MDQTLLILGCLIVVVMGSVHALWTLFTDKFEPREPELLARMKQISPKLTRRLTMWDAWVGFNLSHSLGVILFGLFYIVLALENYAYLRSSVVLNILLVAVPLVFLALALKYWFYAPRNGIILATALIILSLLLRTA
ncbi:MAG: LIC_13387 family protein [Nevskiales bacterium]